jgi:NADH-quinone oxidoreductase subunit M
MVNHGLVVAPIFIIVAILLERTGTEDIREMGGMALRAPVLAALFLIVALATLAMPGSSNFVGEFYILNGLFQAKIVFAFVAISGVAMSAYYALRLYQGTMHNRKPEGLLSREIGWRDAVVLVPLVLCILALALYPQMILKRTDPSVEQTVAKVQGGEASEAQLAEGPSPIGPLTVQEAREIIQSAPAPESRPVVGENP